ncbi:MAG TPA: protein translocase subunit SecF [Ktedonobacteraceae bacterium]
MFNLVGKRYLFLIISLIVIVPGTISLFWKGFDVGIDFAAGSSLEFRPAQHLTSTQAVKNLLDPLGLKDVQVNIGSDASTKGTQVAWIRLNTNVDQNVQSSIVSALKTKYGANLTSVTFDPLVLTPAGGGKATTVMVITLASKTANFVFKAADLEKVLAKLPNTTDTNAVATTPTPTPTAGVSLKPTPTVNATATASTNATATAKANATATAQTKATATAVAKGTPAAASTPTPTATANPNATIPVNVQKVQIGQTTDTINILTTTTTTLATTRKIQAAFLNKTGNFLYTMNNASVSSAVAAATIRYSILAVFAAAALILLYIWFAFRKVNRPWRYGTCAIIALLHDVLVVMGVFSILGWTLHIQIDALFITALLTVVGFSVHDTIVVFDRIRENMQHRSNETFDQVVNASLVQTMARSLNTSLTVLFTLSALTLFGGDSIRSFTFALLIGVFSGTYSSIFNASMLLVIWEHGELGLWRFDRDRNTRGGKRRPSRERELVRSRG